MPLDVLLGKTPKMLRDVTRLQAKGDALQQADISLAEAVKRIMHLPAVAENLPDHHRRPHGNRYGHP